MNRILTAGLLSAFALISCSKDEDENLQGLSGTYTETSPIEGRSRLYFTGENKVTKTERGSTAGDEFTYEISGNTIKLTPTWDNSGTTEFEFELINSSKFKIENLYPDLPENHVSFMTFEK